MVREQQSKFTLLPPLKENHHQQQQQRHPKQGQDNNDASNNNNNSVKHNNRHMDAAAGPDVSHPFSNTSNSLEKQQQHQQQPSTHQSSGRQPPPPGGGGAVVVAFQGKLLPPMKKSSTSSVNTATPTTRLVADRQSRPPLLHHLLVDEKDELQQKRRRRYTNPAVNTTATAATEQRVVTNTASSSSSSSIATTNSLVLAAPTTATTTLARTPTTTVRRGLLRYGELMEDLFGLDQDCSPQYWNDCQTLVDTTDSSDNHNNDSAAAAALWRSILEYASRYRCSSGNDPSNNCSNSGHCNLLSGQDLIKLHRRATSRLSSSSAATATTTLVDENVLAIWLSYARAQMRHGSNAADARLTLRHIQRWIMVNEDNDESSSSKKENMLCNHPDYKQLLSELNHGSSNNNNCGVDKEHQRKQLSEQNSPKERVCGRDEFDSLSPKRQKTEPTSGCAHPKEPLLFVAASSSSSSSFHAPPPPPRVSAAEEQSQCSDMSLETSQETLDADVSLELNDDNNNKNASVRFLLQPSIVPHRQMMMMTATTADVSQRQEHNGSISQQQHVANQENNTPTEHIPTESLQTDASTKDGSANDKKSFLVVQQPRQVVPQKNVTAANHHRLGSASSSSAMLLPPVTNDHPQLPVTHMLLLPSAKDKEQKSSRAGPSPAAKNDKLFAAAPHLSTEATTTMTNSSLVVGLPAAKSSDVVASATPSSSTWLQNRPPRVTMLRSDGALKMQRRPPLRFNKAPGGGGGVSRLGKLGKPKRVDPGTSSLDIESGSDDDDNDTESNVASASAVSNNNRNNKQSSKVPKMDLSYIYEWDPTKRSCGDAAKTKEEKPGVESCSNAKQKKAAPLLPKIDEASTLAAEENTGAAGAAVCTLDQDPEHVVVSTDISTEQPITRSKENRLLADANAEFLPLVSKKNILHVNGVPFAKLGVVGKGGSCKVYRVLSKECSVVAIKKVKLDGMDKRAIDSYANEINLLKSLRGNPAIIQMFDSQVDLQRKAIFVVMELGEVDLNQVLQQQSLLADKHSDGEAARRLNLNFIRLTWHQMLTAVHSIHEARIIHGDLKPANFLFVRGALKLIDFGIAKAMSNDNTTNIYRDSQIGTLNYMSPEAILDSGAGTGNKPKVKMGRASDIWSLGCILYQMVYGKTPFADLRMIPKLHAITDPDHCIDFPDYADPDAIDAMSLCLRRKPEERPPIIGTGGLLDQHCFLHSSRRLRR